MPNLAHQTFGACRSLIRTGAWLALAFAVGAGAQAQEIKIGGTGAALATMQRLADAHVRQHPTVRLTVLPSMGSGGGIKAMLAGATQLAVSARALNAAETQAGAVATEYGRTPLVMAVAASSKVTDLTRQNLVDYYSGKADTWPGGAPLRLVLRPVGDSDTDSLKALSPAMHSAMLLAEQRKGMLFALTDQDTANALEKTPGALGPITLAQLLSEQRSLKPLSLDGVKPVPGALADGSYPLQKVMWLVTGPKPSPDVQAFIDFVRSAAGREILQQTGHWVTAK